MCKNKSIQTLRHKYPSMTTQSINVDSVIQRFDRVLGGMIACLFCMAFLADMHFAIFTVELSVRILTKLTLSELILLVVIRLDHVSLPRHLLSCIQKSFPQIQLERLLAFPLKVDIVDIVEIAHRVCVAQHFDKESRHFIIYRGQSRVVLFDANRGPKLRFALHSQYLV